MKIAIRSLLVALALLTATLVLAPVAGAATTYTVDQTADTGGSCALPTDCTLRQAINDANTNPGADTIQFNIAGAGVHTIQPTSQLPYITGPVTIDGTSQPGYINKPLIQIDGTAEAVGSQGLRVNSTGAGSTIDGLAIDNFSGGYGIVLVNASNTLVRRCFVGIDPTGASAAPNQYGFSIQNGTGYQIGDGIAGHGNVISGQSGSGSGVNIADAVANVQGNLIGTNSSGTAAVPNTGHGVFIQGAGSAGTVIGGNTTGQRNLISGNSQVGVYVFPDSSGISISGNYIGTDVAGTGAVGNGLEGILTNGANTLIADNVVAGNSQHGIELDGGSGTGATGSTVRGNTIGLGSDGTTALTNAGDGVYDNGADLVRIGSAAAGGTPSERNVISHNGNSGVEVHGSTATGVVVADNYIGTDAAGTTGSGNGATTTAPGVKADAPGLTVGGTAASAGNVISANSGGGVKVTQTGAAIKNNLIGLDKTGAVNLGNSFPGVWLVTVGSATIASNVISGNGGDGIQANGSTGDTIQGNRIGTDSTGQNAIANGFKGINLIDSSSNLIGGTGGTGNQISGNGGAQEPEVNVTVSAGSSTSNTIQGNRIGTNAAGTGPLTTPNPNSGPGIELQGGANVHDNAVGASAGAGNVIAFNTKGVVVGDTASDATANNIVRFNSIFANSPGPAIDLGNNGDTVNDGTLDPDTGPNGLQNYPVVGSATVSGASTQITGTLDSKASTSYSVDLYRAASCVNKGQQYLASTNVTTDGSGHATFSKPVTGVSAGDVIAAVATDPNGNSSELSGCKTVSALQADLGVTLSAPSSPAQVGSPVTYGVHLSNGGPDPAPNAQAIVQLPDGADFSSASAGCAYSGSTVICTSGTLAAGASHDYSITVIPREERTLQAHASASSDASDPNSSNDSKTAFTAAHLPPPALHRSVDVRPVSGTVLIKQHGHFVPLKFGETVPLGSILDTTHGRVRLTSAKSAGVAQTADFYAGQFRVSQTKGSKPVTMLTLLGRVDSCSGHKFATVSYRRRRRRLWGSGHGSFGTSGRYGSGSVRGTIWLTEDRCDGTYFKVNRGVVAVRDFRRRRTVLVRKGHSLFVKAR